MEFGDPGVFHRLLTASESAVEDLPYGVVGMDLDGTVLTYNQAESELAGLDKERVLGRHFFSEVAPCTNNFMVAGRFEDEDELDEAIDYVFTLRMKPSPVRLRMLKSTAKGRQFLLVERR